MVKSISLLLLCMTLLLIFDETLSHFDIEGNIDLKGSTTYATVNSGLQKFHDHLWYFSSDAKENSGQYGISINCNADETYLIAEFIFRIWQPPKPNDCGFI